LSPPARAPIGIEAEERAHRDPQRQLAREAIEVERRVGAEAIERRARLGGHDRVGGLDALAVEGREHDPAALAMEVAVDGQQAVAQQRDEIAHEAPPPGEVGGVGDVMKWLACGPSMKITLQWKTRIVNTGPKRS
jgi:hypothetical protein